MLSHFTGATQEGVEFDNDGFNFLWPPWSRHIAFIAQPVDKPDDAQQMLMAFSRLRSKYEPKANDAPGDFSDESVGETDDFSDAQDNA